jgi:hypothetical protein
VLDAVHETLSSTLPVPPVGLGVDWIAQFVPFQLSARVSWVPELFV